LATHQNSPCPQQARKKLNPPHVWRIKIQNYCVPAKHSFIGPSSTSFFKKPCLFCLECKNLAYKYAGLASLYLPILTLHYSTQRQQNPSCPDTRTHGYYHLLLYQITHFQVKKNPKISQKLAKFCSCFPKTSILLYRLQAQLNEDILGVLAEFD
jgi:hypothetical protein